MGALAMGQLTVPVVIPPGHDRGQPTTFRSRMSPIARPAHLEKTLLQSVLRNGSFFFLASFPRFFTRWHASLAGLSPRENARRTTDLTEKTVFDSI
jgi:hypothetical protein